MAYIECYSLVLVYLSLSVYKLQRTPYSISMHPRSREEPKTLKLSLALNRSPPPIIPFIFMTIEFIELQLAQIKAQQLYLEEPCFSPAFHLAFNDLLKAVDTVLLNGEMNYCTSCLPALKIDSLGIQTTGNLRQEETYKKVLLVIEQNLGNPELSPRFAATQSFLSLSKLNKLFKNHNTSFGKEVKLRRLQKVASLLICHDSKHLSIGLMASQCGFSDQSHFNKLFRTAYGQTPKQYRDQHFRKKPSP